MIMTMIWWPWQRWPWKNHLDKNDLDKDDLDKDYLNKGDLNKGNIDKDDHVSTLWVVLEPWIWLLSILLIKNRFTWPMDH